MQNAERNIRIRATHIRQRLLARNGSPYFRQTLARLSDEELVRLDHEQHQRKVKWVTEQSATKKSLNWKVVS